MRAWALMLLLASPVGAASVAVCDPTHPSTVVDVVIEYRKSANTPDYDQNPDALINPDVSAVEGIVPRKYWQCDRPGNAVVEMSAADKTTYDAWLQSEADLASDGVGDRACLSNNTSQDINAINGENVVLWDTQPGVFHARTYTHTLGTAAFCVDKRGTYVVTGVLVYSSPGNYIGRVKLRKNGTPRFWRVAHGDSQSMVIPGFPVLMDVGDCVSLAVDRESGNGAATLTPDESAFCMVLANVRGS